MHSLWLATLISAVLVFVTSSLVHMVLPWHKNDFPRLANEDAVMDALRPLRLAKGDYLVPRPATRQELNSPAFIEKRQRGPVVVFTVMGEISMGRNLGLWFVYLLVVIGLSALAAGVALPPGTDSHRVFHLIALTSFLGFALALWQNSIWWSRSWVTTLKSTVDGLIYALITAGVFVWLWPR